MFGHVADIVGNSGRADNDLALELEKYVLKSFETDCVGQIEEAFDALESDRGEKTYIFPWEDPDSYGDLLRIRQNSNRKQNDFYGKTNTPRAISPVAPIIAATICAVFGRGLARPTRGRVAGNIRFA